MSRLKKSLALAFAILLIGAHLFVGCAPATVQDRPFQNAEITDVSFIYGADGGSPIPLTDAEKQEIITMLGHLEISAEDGFSTIFYGGNCCLVLTTAQGECIEVYIVYSNELYLAIEQDSGGSEKLWYPVVGEVGEQLYAYCVAIAEK